MLYFRKRKYFFFLEMNYFSFIIDTLFENEVLKKIIITVLLLNIIWVIARKYALNTVQIIFEIGELLRKLNHTLKACVFFFLI
jgi:hypothetical protein